MWNRCLSFRNTIWPFVLVLLLGAVSYADEVSERDGAWAGLHMGAGQVELSLDDRTQTDTLFYLAFEGGYAIIPAFLLGLELSGWLYEASDTNDEEEGEGLSQVFLVTRYYPLKENDFFTKVAGGYVSHWSNEYGRTKRKEGWGISVGGGYDIAVANNWWFTPSVIYNYGDAGGQTHSAFTLALGITWR